MIYALEQTSGAEHAMLRNAIESADTSNIDDIINILVRVNAFDFTRSAAEIESQKAMNALNSLPESDYRSALRLLCEQSLKRTS
jgi:octaprenyl-diphosphate synthase